MASRCDPDRMRFEDLHLEDLDDNEKLEAMMDYIEHPNTQALHDDLGRDFRSQPAEDQRAELLAYLATQKAWQEKFAELTNPSGSAELEEAQQKLRKSVAETIASTKRRLAELDGPGQV